MNDILSSIASNSSNVSNFYRIKRSDYTSHDTYNSHQYRDMPVAKRLKQTRPLRPTSPPKKKVRWTEEELSICRYYYNDIYSVELGFDLYSQFLNHLISNQPIGPYDCPIKYFPKLHLDKHNIKQGFKNLGLKAVPKGPTPRPKSDPALRTIWTEEEKAILQEYHTIFKKSRNVESSIYQGFLQWINLEEQQYKKSKFPAGHIANEKRIRHGFRTINVQSTDLKQSAKLYNESCDESSDESSDKSSDESMVKHVIHQRVVRGEGNHSK
jgi:hypothetical protein